MTSALAEVHAAAAGMSFGWTEDQVELRDTIVAFARRELESADDDDLGSTPYSRERWAKCAAVGIQGLNVPEPYGGQGADVLTTIAALEALGYGTSDNGLIFSLNAHMWAVEHPLVAFGSEELKHRFLPGLCDGSLIGAHAMSEPEAGSDAFSMLTTATRDGDRFRLDGSKTFVTNAPAADVFIVFATTDRSAGFLGVTAFVVERDTPGVEVGEPFSKMGLGSSPMSEMFFDGAVVPVHNVLGRVNRGAQVFNRAMERERSMILASSVGSMQRLVERSVEHAQARRQFGQPIGKFQAVAHRLVEMRLRLESARLLLYRLGWLVDNAMPVDLEAALVKLHLSESYIESSLDAMSIHGGYGYMAEYDLEREVRDALGSRFYSGTSDMQRNLAARAMGL